MQNKIHNRTLFVAALSVYFGLLIVGAPSQVFAQTQIIKIEAKQGKCNQTAQPEIESLLSKSFYAQTLADFLIDINNLSALGKFPPNGAFAQDLIYGEGFLITRQERLTELNPMVSTLNSSKKKNVWLAAAFQETKEKLKTELDGDSNSLFKIKLTGNHFSAETFLQTGSSEKAEKLADFYNTTFNSKVCQESRLKVLYENTKAFADKDQVFIVTHLPRAAIDEFLKADAKPSSEK